MTSRETVKAPAPRLSAATRATYVAFISCGFAMASWASRIPQVRDRLHLTPADLGMVLLAIAAGSITALLLAGVIVSRFHSRRTVTAMAGLQGVALAALALGYLVGVVPVVVALFVFGFSAGAWDVAMNVQGAAVERRLGRAMMPRFHAGYSIGTVAGALVGVGGGRPPRLGHRAPCRGRGRGGGDRSGGGAQLHPRHLGRGRRRGGRHGDEDGPVGPVAGAARQSPAAHAKGAEPQ